MSWLIIFSCTPLRGQDTALPEQTVDTSPEQADTYGQEGRQPEDSLTQYKEGFLAHRVDGNLPEATNRLRRAINMDEKNWRALYEMGKVYYARGLNDSAVQTWEKGLEAPSRFRSWFERELSSHRLRYGDFATSPATKLEWSFLGRVKGNVLGREKNINPSALQLVEGEGFLSASYGSGSVIKYSDGGRLIKRWDNFNKPVDIASHPNRGYLVADYEKNTIHLITPENGVEIFSEAIDSPWRLLTLENKIFVYSDSQRKLVQLNYEGDTVAELWEASPGNRIEDLTVGPAGNFWIIERSQNQLIVINQLGETVNEYNYEPRDNYRRIRWIDGELFMDGEQGLVNFEPGGEASPLVADGEVISGSQISDVFIHGDRLYVSRFEESDILIYRSPRQPEPDILIQDRRYHFENYPVIRLNLIIDDPLRSDRFRTMGDHDFGVHISNQESLPSFLRRTRQIFTPTWYLVVDNRFASVSLWEEMRAYLEKIITNAPDDTRGSILELARQKTVQGLTDSRVYLRNALNSILLHEEQKPGDNDQVMVEYLDRIFDLATARRGPVGIILFSPHLQKNQQEFARLANRARNNKTPLVVISPSSTPLPQNHHLKAADEILTQNFTNLDSLRVWDFYETNINRHFTAVFRSPVGVLEHARWMDLALEFRYLNRVYNFDGGYVLP
ncbi:MAG: hypothetical protein ACQEP7_01600 [bacterium]